MCPICFSRIKFIIPPVCEKCGRPAYSRPYVGTGGPSNSLLCPECNKKHNIFFDRAFSVALYEGVWKELIHLFKYGKNDCLDKFLAGFLIELIRKNSSLKESDLIIPVPLHWQERWRRSYDQTYLLAYEVSRMTNIPVCVDKLIKHKKIPSQTTLSGKERLKNVKGAFKINNPKILRDKKILLIDDVFTTGSTVNECTKELRKAKVRRVDVITLTCSY